MALKNPAAEPVALERRDRADREHRRRLAVAEADGGSGQEVVAARDHLLAQERQRQHDHHGGPWPGARHPRPRPRRRRRHHPGSQGAPQPGGGLQRDGQRRDGEQAHDARAHRRQDPEDRDHGQVEEREPARARQHHRGGGDEHELERAQRGDLGGLRRERGDQLRDGIGEGVPRLDPRLEAPQEQDAASPVRIEEHDGRGPRQRQPRRQVDRPPPQPVDERRAGVEPQHRDAQRRQRVRVDPDELEREGREEPAPVAGAGAARVGVAAEQPQLRREAQRAGQLRPRHEASLERQKGDAEPDAEQRRRSDAPQAGRGPQEADGGQRERDPEQADAHHAAAVGERQRDLKQPVHVDVRTTGERVGEGIDPWPGAVLEDPAPGGQVVPEVAGRFRAPGEGRRQARHREEHRVPGPRVVPRNGRRCTRRRLGQIGAPGRVVALAGTRRLRGRPRLARALRAGLPRAGHGSTMPCGAGSGHGVASRSRRPAPPPLPSCAPTSSSASASPRAPRVPSPASRPPCRAASASPPRTPRRGRSCPARGDCPGPRRRPWRCRPR